MVMVRSVARTQDASLTDDDLLLKLPTDGKLEWMQFCSTLTERIAALRFEAELYGERVWQAFDRPLVIAEPPTLPVGPVAPMPRGFGARRPGLRLDITCPCGIRFSITPGQAHRRRYCSQPCQWKFHRPSRERMARVSVACPCGATFQTLQSIRDRGWGKFCSRLCRNEYSRRQLAPFVCQDCGPTHRKHAAHGLCRRCYQHRWRAA